MPAFCHCGPNTALNVHGASAQTSVSGRAVISASRRSVVTKRWPRAAGLSRATAAASLQEPVPVPEPTEKAMSYYRGGVALWLFDVAWGLLVPGVILFTGLSARMRTWAARIGRKWFFVIALYYATGWV